jgi:hypothetical protein
VIGRAGLFPSRVLYSPTPGIGDPESGHNNSACLGDGSRLSVHGVLSAIVIIAPAGCAHSRQHLTVEASRGSLPQNGRL